MTTSGLVIFDCDGVLVDSEGISQRVLQQAIVALGVEMTVAEVEAAFKGTTAQAVETGVGERLGRAVPDGWWAQYVVDLGHAFDVELRAVDGAAEAVAGVGKLGWEHCVASQGRVAKMEHTLGLTGLRGSFADDRIFSATMVALPKPAPDLFLHAARTCGYPPERCVVVEDTPIGVRAARAAGMRVLGYSPNGNGTGLAALGAELVADMRDVPARIAGG
jgi:beta-phosphoglucomutase-like phosphatase (HAD superfamily)